MAVDCMLFIYKNNYMILCGSRVIVDAELNGLATEAGACPTCVRQTLSFLRLTKHMAMGL